MSTLLPTLTHARIRAAQGDVEGARGILEEILAARPGDLEAQLLLRDVARARGAPRAAEPAEEALPPPVPGEPALLSARFAHAGRATALEAWLERLRRGKARERAG